MLSSHILPELSSVCDLAGIVEKGRLLAFGTVREIITSLQENIILSITLQGETKKAADLCSNHSNIKEVTSQGNEIRAVYVGPRSEIAEINRLLVENNIKVIGFREEEGDLEEAFLRVTKQTKETNKKETADSSASTKKENSKARGKENQPGNNRKQTGTNETNKNKIPEQTPVKEKHEKKSGASDKKEIKQEEKKGKLKLKEQDEQQGRNKTWEQNEKISKKG